MKLCASKPVWQQSHLGLITQYHWGLSKVKIDVIQGKIQFFALQILIFLGLFGFIGLTLKKGNSAFFQYNVCQHDKGLEITIMRAGSIAIKMISRWNKTKRDF